MSAERDDTTVEVRAGMSVDEARLAGWLREHVSGFEGPLSVRQFKGGQSNPTYLLTTPSRRYVLRRKPPGVLLASAHAVDREYRVITALREHSDVPVPRTFALCTDETIAGTWFYVMEHVVGRVYWDPAFPELAREQRAPHADAANAALASLHRVDPVAAGLADFGRAQGYMSRQIARWSKQYLDDGMAGRIPAMDRLVEWLPRHLPGHEEPPAIVHGDYRVDNLVFHPHEPRVIAILDWELSTIGDPLADFTYYLMTYRLPTLSLPGLLGRDPRALGIPSEREAVAAYCRRTGRDAIGNLDFHVAYNMFRLAAIFHGIRGRVLRGTAVSAQARDYAQHVETIADLAWAQAERAACPQRSA